MASPGSADKWRGHAPQLALFRRANASRAGKLACCVVCQSGGNGDIPSRHHDAVPNRLKDLFEVVVCPFLSRAFQRNPHFQAVRSKCPHREVSFRRRCSLSFMISLKSATGRISIGPSPYLKPGCCETS